MTHGSRGRRWARLGGAVAIGAIVAVVASTSPATAGGVVGTPTVKSGVKVQIEFKDKKVKTLSAGQISIKVGDKEASAYCIDISHGLGVGIPYIERSWTKSSVANLGNIQWILTNGYPSVSVATILEKAKLTVPAGTNDETLQQLVYAAHQSAIWHFSDGASLVAGAGVAGLPSSARYKLVLDLYAYLVDAAAKAPTAEPTATLKITSSILTAVAGTTAGPFTVETTGTKVEISATGGTVVDASGKALTGSLSNGGQFWITSTTAGTVKIQAKGVGTVPVGRIFVSGDRQKVILAGGSLATSISAEATVQFNEITCQQAGNCQNSGGDQPEEEAPAASPTASSSAAASGPSLPVTGASVLTTVGVGLVLMTGGVLTAWLVRRRKIRFTA